MLGKQNKAGRRPRIYNLQNPTKKILIIIICSLLTRVHSFTFLKNQHLVYPDKEFNDDDNNNDNLDIMNTLQNISLMEQDLYGERKSK
mmetsp:Transcript_62620/g.70061  ORF Transcript_62620/g.70061 Transcript_62620/m.70061 type:complete len:88 (+) Transcript_62620:89-352(+)